MAYQVEHYITNPARCPYLEDRMWQLESRILLDVTKGEMQALLERGWRRFGPEYFRPACRQCRECISIRIPVADFKPSKSQRRARNKLRELTIEVGDPIADQERLRLYHRWHREREMVQHWEPSPLSLEHYSLQFCFPHPCAREVTYRDGDRLVAVGIVDLTDVALSSVYFFYDPEYRKLSPGIGSVLIELDLARESGLEHVYLGYRVAGCGSLAYKDQFRPNELLIDRPELQDFPHWIRVPRAPTIS